MNFKTLGLKVILLLSLVCTTLFSNENNTYDSMAKYTYSHNDVKSFVFKWFAMFDHQENIEQFKKYLPTKHVQMHFPDFPIKTMADFQKWYQGVIDNIQFNAHHIRDLKVKGNEKEGFDVSFIVNWKAKTYDKQTYDVDVKQQWHLEVNHNRVFIITKHKAWLVEEQSK